MQVILLDSQNVEIYLRAKKFKTIIQLISHVIQWAKGSKLPILKLIIIILKHKQWDEYSMQLLGAHAHIQLNYKIVKSTKD